MEMESVQSDSVVREAKFERGVRSMPLRTLNEQSEKRAIFLTDVDWDLSIDYETPWMPESFLAVSYLPSYQKLSDRLRLKFNQHYALALCEQFIWFEQDTISPILVKIMSERKLPLDLESALKNFVKEESLHSEMFWRLLEKAAPELYPTRKYAFLKYGPKQRFFYKMIIEHYDFFVVWIWMAIYFEEKTLDISSRYQKEIHEKGESALDPVFSRVHYLHLMDEVRHVQVDQYLLSYFYDMTTSFQRKLTGILGKKVFSSYALKQQLSRRILFQLASHFPDELKVVYDVLNELNHLGRNRKYKEEMFSDKVIGRTKELMRGYPEMLKVLDVFH